MPKGEESGEAMDEAIVVRRPHIPFTSFAVQLLAPLPEIWWAAGTKCPIFGRYGSPKIQCLWNSTCCNYVVRHFRPSLEHRKALTGAVPPPVLCLQYPRSSVSLASGPLPCWRFVNQNALRTATGFEQLRTSCHAALLHEAARIGQSLGNSL